MLKFYFFALLSLILISVSGRADTQAMVVQDPAYVYKQPDFDAQQIGQLQVGQRIVVSSRKWGPFHKTKLRQGVIGYVSDADIEVAGGKLAKQGEKSGEKSEGGKTKDDGKAKKRGPWWSSFMVGASLGSVTYTELIDKKEFRESALYYGIKASVPVRWFDGPFHLDVNFMYHSGAPSYYNEVADTGTSVTGYFMMLEIPVQFQVTQFWGKDGAIYFGAGPMLNYSRFKLLQKGFKLDLEELRFGGLANAGMAFSFGRAVLKLEPRYYFERASFLGLTANLQFIF